MFALFRLIGSVYRCSCLFIVAILFALVIVAGVLVTNGTITLVGGSVTVSVPVVAPAPPERIRPTNPAPLNMVIERRPLFAIVPLPQEISRRSEVISTNLILALLFTAAIGACAALLNRLWREHEADVRRWLAALRAGWLLQAIGRVWQLSIRRTLLTLPFALLTLALFGLIFALLERGLNLLSAEGIQLALMLALAVGVVSLGGEFAGRLVGRLSGARHRPGIRPANLLVAGVAVALSHAAGLNPGIMFGGMGDSFAGTQPHSAQPQARGGVRALIALAAVALIGTLGWLATGTLADIGRQTLDPEALRIYGPIASLGQTLALAVFVVAAQTAFFHLLPFWGTAGRRVFRWNAALWALLFASVSFVVAHTLINPRGGLLATPNVRAVVYCTAALIAFTLIVWAFFRLAFPIMFRRPGTSRDVVSTGPRWYTGAPSYIAAQSFRPPPPPPQTMTPKIRRGALPAPPSAAPAFNPPPPTPPQSAGQDEPTQPITPAGLSLRLPVPSYESLFPPDESDPTHTPTHGIAPVEKPDLDGKEPSDEDNRPGSLPA